MATVISSSSANSPVSITVPAPRNANRRMELTISVTWSGTPADGTLLTVVNDDGDTEVSRYPAGATERAGVVQKCLKPNVGAVVTLAAMGSGVVGNLTVDYREMPAPARPRSEMERI